MPMFNNAFYQLLTLSYILGNIISFIFLQMQLNEYERDAFKLHYHVVFPNFPSFILKY